LNAWILSTNKSEIDEQNMVFVADVNAISIIIIIENVVDFEILFHSGKFGDASPIMGWPSINPSYRVDDFIHPRKPVEMLHHNLAFSSLTKHPVYDDFDLTASRPLPIRSRIFSRSLSSFSLVTTTLLGWMPMGTD
jgi:hypothetical protein